MQPSQVAALLGREIDLGFAAALSDLSGSRALVVDRIIARVGALPEEAEGTAGGDGVPDWSAVRWQAEVTLRPSTGLTEGHDGSGDGIPAPDPGSRDREALRHRIALLRTSAVRGVGPAWERQLAQWGLESVGDFAAADPADLARRAGTRTNVVLALFSRARDLVDPWPALTAAASGRSVVEIASSSDPGSPTDYVLRAHCLRLVAALDVSVAARVILP